MYQGRQIYINLCFVLDAQGEEQQIYKQRQKIALLEAENEKLKETNTELEVRITKLQKIKNEEEQQKVVKLEKEDQEQPQQSKKGIIQIKAKLQQTTQCVIRKGKQSQQPRNLCME